MAEFEPGTYPILIGVGIILIAIGVFMLGAAILFIKDVILDK